ncbi:hypothetical protein [Deinococcus apachensis]|uniref:hypothetical protein n=1 Tax=Deinococcus apachensis TaxID=309886 RepID=UPI0003663CC2|nr:hypothetical protein [Deinococcus apachensis]
MTDPDNRYGDTPLGRSVEEVEQEGGNLENSPVTGEDLRGGEGDHKVALPSVANANASVVPAVLDPEGMREEEGGGTDRQR